MINKPLRQLQQKVFDVFTQLENDRAKMLEKAETLPLSVDKALMLAKADGLADGIIGLGSLIELIQKQTNDEQQNQTEVSK